jgi:hypothetical protein
MKAGLALIFIFSILVLSTISRAVPEPLEDSPYAIIETQGKILHNRWYYRF